MPMYTIRYVRSIYISQSLFSKVYLSLEVVEFCIFLNFLCIYVVLCGINSYVNGLVYPIFIYNILL